MDVDPNVAAPVTPRPPVTFKLDARLAAPVTAKVELKVAAPATPRVDPNVVAPVTPSPPVTFKLPEALTVETLATPATLSVDPNVTAPVTPSPPAAIFTFDANAAAPVTDNVELKVVAPATLRVPPPNMFPVTPSPPAITTAADVDDVALSELPNVYWPANVVVYDGNADELAERMPPVTEDETNWTGSVPLPANKALAVNVALPVPP